MIPAIDLAAQHGKIKEEVEAGLLAVMETGQFLFGGQAAALEEEVADYLQAGHAVSCGSGTDALLLSLWALGIGPGDEVITTPFTFFATVEAILHTGAKPVFVDIDPRTYNLDTDRLEEAVTARTRAILPVHLFGQPCDMPALMRVAERHGLEVIEDCAQAFGARSGGRAAGTWGAAGCFSFFPSKNLGGYGDGGMVTTGSESLAASLRELCNHGSSERYCHQRIGFNSRLDELQAVVLRAKLKHIGDYNAGRRHAARRYTQALADLEGVVVPEEEPPGSHVYNQYTLQVPGRDRMFSHLREQGIGCAVHYPRPLHQQPVFRETSGDQRYPVAEQLARSCLSLPIYPELSDTQVETVAGAVRTGLGAV